MQALTIMVTAMTVARRFMSVPLSCPFTLTGLQSNYTWPAAAIRPSLMEALIEPT